jgi:hypothetical protein
MVDVRWWTDGDRLYESDGSECEVVRVFGEHVAINCDHEIIATGLRPAGCSVCQHSIPPDAPYPLCTSCTFTAKAHARHFPEGPDAFKARMSR